MQHLAIIMDGNRRWAKRNGLPSSAGHKKGAEAVEIALQYCKQTNITHLSLYVFSLENFKRSADELSFLFDVLANQIYKNIGHYIAQGIRIRFVGDANYFPAQLVHKIKESEEKTNNCSSLLLDLLFCYGGQQEIVAACKQIATLALKGEVSVDEITTETFSKLLWNAPAPPPDLIIRTGNRKRLSNFLLFQSAYSELRFLNEMWPDITQELLEKTVLEVKTTIRSFGG